MIEIKGTHKQVDMMIKIINDTFLETCNCSGCDKLSCEECVFDYGSTCEISDRHFIIKYTD